MPHCFVKTQRLLKASDFKTVFEAPVKSSDACFTILACRNQLTHARLGMAISRKVSKKAVIRNRIKRVLREYFRHHHAQLSGLDLVIMARPALLPYPAPRLVLSLDKHWQTIARRCNVS